MSAFYNVDQPPFNMGSTARAIVAANNGLLFDPSDMTTLYQDAAGTIPVTAVEQPVGLVLDKSQGLMLGPELVSNGTFDTLTGWSARAGCTISSAAGWLRLTYISTGAARANFNPITTIPGKTYRLVFDIRNTLSTVNGSVFVYSDAFATQIAIAGSKQTDGSYSFVFKATSTTTYIDVGNTTSITVGAYLEFDNISVRELYGYHATQSVTASRPVLSARYNLLTKTEDFSDAVWTKAAGGTGTTPSITNNYDIAPDGSQTAIRVQLNKGAGTTSSNLSAVYQNYNTIVGQAYSRLCYVKLTDGAESCRVNFDDISAIGGTSVTITNTWTLVNLSTTATDIARGFRVMCRGGFNTTNTADFLIWHPQLRLGTSAGPYQRVNTSTDYDTNPAYFPKYLRFDGIDDYLNLPYMGLYANGSASVVVAKNEPSSLSANNTILAEGNTTTATPVYSILRYLTVGVGGSSVADSAVTNFSFSTPFIASACSVESAIDSGNYYTFYRNSVGVGGTPKSTVVTTLNNLVLGAVNRGGTLQLYSLMNLYGLIITKSALTDAQRIKCERFLAQKAGVML